MAGCVAAFRFSWTEEISVFVTVFVKVSNNCPSCIWLMSMFKIYCTCCRSDRAVLFKKDLVQFPSCSNKGKFHLVDSNLCQLHLLRGEFPKTLKAQSVDSECSYISRCFCSVLPTSLAVLFSFLQTHRFDFSSSSPMSYSQTLMIFLYTGINLGNDPW